MIFYQAEEGELNVVYTQFGIHLIEVTDRKFVENNEGVQLAYVQESIIPSDNTQDALYDEALDFVAKNRTLADMQKAVDEDPNLTMETAEGLQKNGYIFSTLGSGNTSRDMIRWVFDPSTNTGDVAPEVFVIEDPILYYNSKYVIPALRNSSKPGLAQVQDVKNTIHAAVMNQKKGEMIKTKISGTDLEAIATQFETQVDSVQNVNFNMSYLQALGQEPEVLAFLDAMEKDEVKGPLVGNNGVYMLKLTGKSIASLPTNITTLKNQVATQTRQSADFQLIDALKKAAKIEDNRFTYY